MVILGMENFLDFLILGALIFISILLFSIVQSNEKSKKIYTDLVGLPSPRVAIFIILFFGLFSCFSGLYSDTNLFRDWI